MGNYVLESVDPYEAYRLLSDSIAYFHIKDALYEGAIVPPGVGKARIRDILEAHKGCVSEDFFATLEPHLQLFSGLNSLVGRAFENPYKYSDTESAFRDALCRFKELAL
jgi:sugar phosphate isomerase/epimerase